MSERMTYWEPDRSNADAVEHAKKQARDEGFTVVTVARVAYVERPTGWAVTLVLRDDRAEARQRVGLA